ncbi:MAG: NHL repeat-containing protein [Bacteroidetes bacterium]|nr:NHL repeat-containing protein [Bacteroidota bacterium]
MRPVLAALILFCAAASLSAFAQIRDAGTGEEEAAQAMVEEYRFGSFVAAEAVSADQFGNVFVADAGTSTLLKFDLRGRRLSEVGGPGWDNEQFDRPTGIDARPGIAIYVADMGNNRISRFDRDLHFMAALEGDGGTIDPGFGYPLDVAQSSFEQLFILDGENNRVLAVSAFKSVDRVFGGIASGDGRLQDPVALATDGDKLLYVLESGRVAVFDYFGNFMRQFGSGVFSNAQGIALLPDRVVVVTPDALHFFAPAGDHLRSIDRKSMVLASDAGEFRDAVWCSPFLLILTTHSCILFPSK